MSAAQALILTVDDNPTILAVVREVLKGANYQVVTADNADQALNMLVEQRPHLIISDINMPGMNGRELCQVLKEKYPSIPVMFLTASGDAEDTLAGFELGAEDYLTKPFEPRELVARVKAILRRCVPAASLMQFRNYEVLEPIGSGGMSKVFKGRDKRSGQPVAIKQLLLPKEAGEEEHQMALRRFMQEARTLGHLSHPNLVQILDVISGEQPCIVMEYLDGETLKAYLTRKQRLSNIELLRIATQVAEGLRYIHHQQIVHRDIKPENIFIQSESHIKLTDFGIARNTAQESSLTVTGSVLGTIAYSSPEQLMDSKQVTPRSDIFSFGVMLYELATGRRPFEGSTPSVVIIKIVNAPLAPPSQHRPDLQPRLEEVILRCLEKDPQNRFGAMEEILEIL